MRVHVRVCACGCVRVRVRIYIYMFACVCVRVSHSLLLRKRRCARRARECVRVYVYAVDLLLSPSASGVERRTSLFSPRYVLPVAWQGS